jgi:two-component system, LuxR family, sensor kinase FixL
VEGTGNKDIRTEQDAERSSLVDPALPGDAAHLADVNKLLKQEIAHRRRAEEANAKFAAIVENSTDSIIGQKLDGTIVTWNKGAEAIFGYTADEACGRPISILFPQETIDEQARIFQSIRRGDVVPPFETERVRKDGTRIQVSLTVSPIRDSTGRVVGASRIARDITERKKIEQALRESEAKARGILDTAVDAIITIDARGIIESFNKAAERLFGYKPRDVIGRNVSLLMPDPYRSEHDGYLRNYCETGRAKIIGIGREVVAQRSDGSLFPADLAVSEVQVGDRRLFTGIVRDISERKRLEQEILEISDREKRRIGQDMHDSLGQLLTGIGFKSKSLENKLAAKQVPEGSIAKQIADLVTQAIMQARGLARGLQPVEPRPAGLMSALQELAINVQDLFPVTCTFNCPRVVEIGDPARATHLYRIAQEACNNAIKHGRAKTIVIELSRGADESLVLSVGDDGVGFAQQQPSGTSKGMGMQIMRYRAAVIGATISIRPNGAAGTVVTCQCRLSGSEAV